MQSPKKRMGVWIISATRQMSHGCKINVPALENSEREHHSASKGTLHSAVSRMPLKEKV